MVLLYVDMMQWMNSVCVIEQEKQALSMIMYFVCTTLHVDLSNT